MIKHFSFFLSLLLVNMFCLQGPWEYLPEDIPIFRGLTVNAYIVADRRVTNICIDRLYALDETNTQAFPFYDSAHITITGDGGEGKQTITLEPDSVCPMCFVGPKDFIGQSGESYHLEAVIWWDSAGIDVKTTITGDASIPERFRVNEFAKVNKAAIRTADTPSLSVDNPMAQQLFGDLPSDVATIMLTLYLPEIQPIMDDSAALIDYYMENGKRIQNTLDSLLSDESQLIPYSRGDTLVYLSGALNFAPHYFSIDHSEDIAGVLITHVYDTNGITPFNEFDNIAATFGPLEPSHFYVPGTEYRVQYLPVITDTTSDNPITLFDSLPIINGYMHGGKNTFYFYGTDSNYDDFVLTYIEQHSSPDVTPIHSVDGAHGFFTGMNVDSFTLYIVIPPDIQAYTTLESRADECSDDEWETADCRCFEPIYCQKVNFNEMQYAFDNPDTIREPEERNNCLAEAVAYYLEQGKSYTYVEDSLLIDGTTIEYNYRDSSGTVMKGQRVFTNEELTSARYTGLVRYCVRNNFGDTLCREIEFDCREWSGYPREVLFNWCEDNNWQGEPCGWAAVLYCRDMKNSPKALCEAADRWCEDNPDDPVCK